MAALSTTDILRELTAAIAAWTARLNELHEQIAYRQHELAQLAGHDTLPLPAPSCGSMESLLPKENHGSDHMVVPRPIIQGIVTPSPGPALQRSEHVEEEAMAATTLPQDTTAAQSPGEEPSIINLRKKKQRTDSLMSVTSRTPKSRSHSMIIVYYDGTVQQTWTDIVQSIRLHRSKLRKSRLARTAVEGTETNAVQNGFTAPTAVASVPRYQVAKLDRAVPNRAFTDEGVPLHDQTNRNTDTGVVVRAEEPPSPDHDLEPDAGYVNNGDAAFDAKQLVYKSTRRMAPPIPCSHGDKATHAFTIPVNPILRRSHRQCGSTGTSPTSLDALDEGLEWCQTRGEYAAHLFLRQGDCLAEIVEMKTRFAQIALSAEKVFPKLEERIQADATHKHGCRPVSAAVRTHSAVLKRKIMASSS